MPISLIVTADDFGIGRATSQGIIQAHLHGPVTATSLMVLTGDHVRASIPLLADAPNLDVGLHLMLTDCGEKPLVARQSSGLVDADDRFWSNRKLWIKAHLGKLNQRAVADEIAAQTDLFHKLMGRAPAYVDCHHHAHQLPIIRQAILDVIDHHLLPPVTRVTIEPHGMMRQVNSCRLKRRAAHWLGQRAKRVFSTKWLWTNDAYFGMLSQPDLQRPFPWDRYLESLPNEGVIEWVVHPGLPDDSLSSRDSYTTDRVTELTALTSDSTRGAWEHLRPLLTRKSLLARKPEV